MRRMTKDEIEAVMDQGFPDWRSFSEIVSIGDRDLVLRISSSSARAAPSRAPR